MNNNESMQKHYCRAWAYKEQMVEFWHQPDAESAATSFAHWYRSVSRSPLPKIKKVAKTLKAHFGNLLIYFKHRITNALAEGLNSKVQAIKADARGYRRFGNYRTRILFFAANWTSLLNPLTPCPTTAFPKEPGVLQDEYSNAL
jgi:transposase